jgi:uncharacterized membrane protein
MKHGLNTDKKTPSSKIHWLLAALLAMVFAFVIATQLVPTKHFPGNSNWPETGLLLIATISTLFALERQLPLQNVLLVAFVIALIGGAISAFGAISGIPFGPFTFTSELGPKIFHKLPWAIPLIWVVTILNSRGVARLILRPWRKTKTYGFWLMGLSATLTMLFVLALDPFAARIKHYWFWTPVKFPLTWQGAPLVDFLSWGIVTLLILAFVTPALIGKRLSKRSTPDFHPLAVWLGAVLLFATDVAMHGLWLAFATDLILVAAVTVFAIRGARW